LWFVQQKGFLLPFRIAVRAEQQATNKLPLKRLPTIFPWLGGLTVNGVELPGMWLRVQFVLFVLKLRRD